MDRGRRRDRGRRVIHPFTVLRGRTIVRTGAEVGPHVVVLDSEIGPGAVVGPFAYLRPGATIGAEAKVGAFVEVKNSTLGERVKVPPPPTSGTPRSAKAPISAPARSRRTTGRSSTRRSTDRDRPRCPHRQRQCLRCARGNWRPCLDRPDRQSLRASRRERSPSPERSRSTRRTTVGNRDD